MQIPVYNTTGEVADNIQVSDDVFGVAMNEGVTHQALVRQLANRRQGTASTKTRSTVSGSGKKQYAQKHTGRARKGDATASILKGGAVAFGPHPRDHRKEMPKKMRRLALKCALSAKLSGEHLKVVEGLAMDRASTRTLAQILNSLQLGDSVLIATGQVEPNVVQSARNLSSVGTTPAAQLNVGDILSYKVLLMTVDAVRKAEELWGAKQENGSAERRVAKDRES